MREKTRFCYVKYWAKGFSKFMSYLVKVTYKFILFLTTLKNVLDKTSMTHFCFPFFLSTCALKSSKVAKIGTFIFLVILSRKQNQHFLNFFQPQKCEFLIHVSPKVYINMIYVSLRVNLEILSSKSNLRCSFANLFKFKFSKTC